MNSYRTAALVAVLGLLVVAASLGAFYFAGGFDQAPGRKGPTSQSGAFTPLSPPTRGGPFSLVDHGGRAVTDKNFRGRFMLVFFGYTYCPDICPTELQTMSDAVEILGKTGKKVQPIFVTVDPERDTVEVMAEYVSAFHPRMIGLTGGPDQIASAAKIYHAGYMKVPLPSDEGGKGGQIDSEDYGVAHTALTYLVGPRGRILTTYPRGIPPKDMAQDIRLFLESSS